MRKTFDLREREGRPLVSYVSTRLAFRRRAIELLPPDGWLEVVVRPTGTDAYTITMTRADFEREFPDVLRSRSWSQENTTSQNLRKKRDATSRRVHHRLRPPQRDGRSRA
jgi:hypothetical protein